MINDSAVEWTEIKTGFETTFFLKKLAGFDLTTPQWQAE
jgi:hypothetical protein